MSDALLSEMVELDAATLADHTFKAGDIFDVGEHRRRLEASLNASLVVCVRRCGQLVAYAMLRPETGSCWFVSSFTVHPNHRTGSVMRSLFRQLNDIAMLHGIIELRSHVYRTNRLSIAFHRRLGFMTLQKSERAIEFSATINQLSAHHIFSQMR